MEVQQSWEIKEDTSEEFKREAVELRYSSGRTIKELDNGLGIHDSLINAGEEN
jgi:transposase-like protein